MQACVYAKYDENCGKNTYTIRFQSKCWMRKRFPALSSLSFFLSLSSSLPFYFQVFFRRFLPSFRTFRRFNRQRMYCNFFETRSILFFLWWSKHFMCVCVWMRLIRKWYVKMGMDFWVRRYRFFPFLSLWLQFCLCVCACKRVSSHTSVFFQLSLNLMVSIDSGEEKRPRSFCNRFAEIIQKLTHLNTISALNTSAHMQSVQRDSEWE